MKTGIREIGKQIVALLESLDDTSYQEPLEIYNGSTLGQHFRHIIEFFDNLSKADMQEIIDYSDRERNPILESDTCYAIQRLKIILDKIVLLDEDLQLKIKGDFLGVDPLKRPVLKSTIGREMMFAYDHSVHHLAIIKIGIQNRFPHIEVNEILGLAPSTIRFRIEN